MAIFFCRRPRCRSPPTPFVFEAQLKKRMEEILMATINLRKLFPQYELDCFVEVPDDEAEAFIAGLTEELAYV